jgi:hypothetical protein
MSRAGLGESGVQGEAPGEIFFAAMRRVPSPLAGEGAERSEADEGSSSWPGLTRPSRHQCQRIAYTFAATHLDARIKSAHDAP